jgi:hypothetical protein
MAWGTGVLRVIAGKLVRRGGATSTWFVSWSEMETARANEQVVGGAVETPHARCRFLVRGRDLSREAETCRGRCFLAGDLSGKPPVGRRQGVLPVMVLARIWSSLSCWILAFTLSMESEDSSLRVIISPSKGTPNIDSRHPQASPT